jgi:hypothetical protein
MKDAKGHGSDAHSTGVDQIGRPKSGTRVAFSPDTNLKRGLVIHGVPSVVVNGRSIPAGRVTGVNQVSPARWDVSTSMHPIPVRVEGGRQAGGTSRDWFVSHPTLYPKGLDATSFAHAVKQINNT